jgi:hypothetical protein
VWRGQLGPGWHHRLGRLHSRFDESVSRHRRLFYSSLIISTGHPRRIKGKMAWTLPYYPMTCTSLKNYSHRHLAPTIWSRHKPRMPHAALPLTASCSRNGAVFPLGPRWTAPTCPTRSFTQREAARAETAPWPQSIASLRILVARVLAERLPCCLLCCALRLQHSSTGDKKQLHKAAPERPR